MRIYQSERSEQQLKLVQANTHSNKRNYMHT